MLAMKKISLIINKSKNNYYYQLISLFFILGFEEICCQFDVSEHCLWSKVKTEKITNILLIETAWFDKAKH